MARCARRGCRQWRPGVLVRVAGLGLYLDEAWYCSAPCLGAAVRERLAHTAPIVPPAMPASTQTRLGGVLALQKRLAPSVVEQAASAQVGTGLRIGTQLVELGLVSRLDVLRALAAQSGVGFLTALDPARLAHAPGNLSPAVVRALGVVPFEADRRHDVLKVACTAPVPRGSLAALRELTGSIIEPYLVADELWPALLHAYGAAQRSSATTPTTVADIDTLASRVADAARQSRAVRMSEARCDDNLWVRLDVGGRIEELLLTTAHVTARYAPLTLSARSEAPVQDRQTDTTGAGRPARPKRPRAPRTSQPRTRRPRQIGPIPEPLAAAPAAPLVDVPATMAASVPPVVEAPTVDLSFLEAWDSRSVPLFER
jgi:hypothetical protein